METFNTNQFRFNKDRRTLSASMSAIIGQFYVGGFPSKFTLESAHTGRVVEFETDDEAAIRNEFWDGEMCEYISRDTDVRVVFTRD